MVATKYGIISKGHIIKEITAEQLHEEMSKTTDIMVDQPEALYQLFESNKQKKFIHIPNGLRFLGEVDLNEILSAIIAQGIHITAVNCRESSFEDYYLETIGGKRK